MTSKQRAIWTRKRIAELGRPLSDAIAWIKQQIGQPIHPLQNPNGFNQQKIDQYWRDVLSYLE